MPHYVPEYTDATLNIGATVRSKALNVSQATTVGYAIRTAGTAVGTWSVQYSNDFVDGVDDPTVDTKWDTYTLTTTPPAASGSAQTFGITLDFFEYKYVRIKFTYTSGAGTAFIAAKMKG